LRILVTGGDGQLGRCIAERATEHPELHLVMTSRGDADLSSAGSVAAVVEAARAHVVVNAAAYTAVDEAEDEPALAFRINGEAAGEAAEAAVKVGARFIQISTDYVFDGLSPGPYAEDAAPNPLSVYGRSKLAGEQAARAAQPECLILRTAWIYSPFGRNFVKSIVAAARQRDELSIVDDQHGNPTSAFDLAEGILAMIESWRRGSNAGLGETFHLAGSGRASWRELAEAIMEQCASRGLPAARVRPIATEDWAAKAIRPRNSTFDCRKFAREFDFRMPEWWISLPQVVDRLARVDG
jgi:dTDP-4-dehydrorhamnose reductase